MLSDVISLHYYWYFADSPNKVGILHYKWILMFATGLSATINPLAMKLSAWWKLQRPEFK
jgi:hypothetical protein